MKHGDYGSWQRFFALPILLVSISRAEPSRADESGLNAAAQTLFDRAKELMAQGLYAEACQKLEESERLDPALGTVFNLADCYERQGKTASAWSLFLQASAAASARNEAGAARIATERAEKLAAVVPRLTIQVTTSEAVPGLVIERSGVLVGFAQWNVPIAVNPGLHEITASAPGHVRWETQVTIAPGDRTATLIVPALTPERTEPDSSAVVGAPPTPVPTQGRGSEPSAPPIASRPSGTVRPLSLVLGGAGIAGVSASLVLGALAKSQYDGADCSKHVCTDAGSTARDSAYLKADVATVLFTVGATALATSAVLWFTLGESADEGVQGTRSTLRVGFGPTQIQFGGAL